VFARHYKSANIWSSKYVTRGANGPGANQCRQILCAGIRNSQIHTSRRSLLTTTSHWRHSNRCFHFRSLTVCCDTKNSVVACSYAFDIAPEEGGAQIFVLEVDRLCAFKPKGPPLTDYYNHLCCFPTDGRVDGRQPSPCPNQSEGAISLHHLRFAQPRALGVKVSDEFTVPFCRASPAASSGRKQTCLVKRFKNRCASHRSSILGANAPQ